MSATPAPAPDSLFRRLFTLALPIIAQNFIVFGVGFADNLMVGQLGGDAINGLYFGNRVFFILQIFLFGLESSVVILSAQYWGQRNTRRIKEVVSITVRLGMAISGAFALACLIAPEWLLGLFTDKTTVVGLGAKYLRIVGASFVLYGANHVLITAMRAVEVVRVGLINSLVALVVNVALNYLLILGHCGFPALGVTGAAIGTLISCAVEFSVVLWYVLKIDGNLQMRLPDFAVWDADIFHDLCRYGWPLMAGQAVWAVNNLGQMWIVGHMAEEVITGVSLAGMLDQIVGMGVFGLAAGVGIITGKLIGAGQLDVIKWWARRVQLLFIGLGVVSGLFVFCVYPLFLRCYNLTPETVAVTGTLMLVLAGALVGRCYQAPCLLGLVKSGGDTSFVFKNDFFFVFVVVLPSAYLCLRLGAPAWAVYACLLSDQILKCFVALWKINTFNWVKNLTRA